jgi:Na+/proline symporter
VVPLRSNITEAGKVTVARISVIGLGVIAYYFAVNAGGVYELIQTAVAFGTAGIFVVGTIGLFTSFGDQYSAFTGLFIGSAVWVAGEFVFSWETPYLFALVSAAIAYTLVAMIEHRLFRQLQV